MSNLKGRSNEPSSTDGPLDGPITYKKRPWVEFACGWGAAFANISITYPVNKLIFRQMLHGVSARGAFSQLQSEGLLYLYRGMLPPLCQKSLSVSFMFGVYEEIRVPLLNWGVNKYLANSTGAVVAGVVEGVFTPFERIQTLLADATFHAHFKNTLQTFRILYVEFGLMEYYRGLTPILLRNGSSTMVFFLCKDEVKMRTPKFESQFHRLLSEFLCGATIGAAISSFIYPLNVAKIAMQSKLGGTYENVYQVLFQIYVERGCKLRYIYRGAFINCTRAFLGWGVINVAYENLITLLSLI